MRKRHHLPALALLAPTLTVSSACDADPVEPDVDQRAVLETVYGKMNGDGWYRNDNWNTDAPLDAWHGVGTDGRGNVISLEMRANGVTGVLAPELAMLRNLKSLVLNDNGLTGSVPPELGNLQNLEKLFLSQNQLTGAIPPDIYRLGKLTLLAIYGNEMAGPISPELSKLTALEELHLGGNGFYWRVAFSDDWPGAMELRRAEDGVRNWQTGPGESYHAWGGEYGGMWRRQGRAPNEICGIGFAAQGFDKATYFVRDPAVDSSRAAWILDGVPDERIGTSGLGGGAAGQELDRYDVRLGSPEHAVMLASATTFGPDMLRTKEEFEGSVHFPTPDPMVRADMVFYETPNGGAVFSVGSISWFGALARDGYDNDIARITANVVRRFADPEPFPPSIA